MPRPGGPRPHGDPLLCALALQARPLGAGAAEPRPNVLLVVFDDLRPGAGAYGHGHVHTPNLDRLAGESLVFDRAYTNYPYCSPSRNSFMSGRLPDRTRVWNFVDSFRDAGVGDQWTSMPEFFKQHGYWTVGSGKLFHPGFPAHEDNPRSWSENLTDPGASTNGCGCPDSPTRDAPHAPMYCGLPEDTNCSDVVIADTVVGHLRRWNTSRELREMPFFVALGIHKPHLPWGAPVSYFEKYLPVDNITLAAHRQFPSGAPTIAYHACHWEPFGRQDPHTADEQLEERCGGRPGFCAITEGYGPANCTPHGRVIDDTWARHARHGYYAAVSFGDALLGRVLREVRSIGVWNDTIVLLTSDHGWHLGEQNEWCKTTLFELALHVPFVIRDPRPSAPYGHAGYRTLAFAENVDIYRTLADLAGLGSSVEESVQGTSLAPLLVDPKTSNPSAKAAAYSQQARCLSDPKTRRRIDVWTTADSCTVTPRSEIDFMCYSIRTDKWRFTVWLRWDGANLEGNWTDINSTELYDHTNDVGTGDAAFDSFEFENVASLHPSVTAELFGELKAHFTDTDHHFPNPVSVVV